MRIRQIKRINRNTVPKLSLFSPKHFSLFLCTISYFLGLILGAANLSSVSSSSNYFALFAEQYFQTHLNQQVVGIWQTDFLSALFLLVLLLFCSLSCLGAPVALTVPCMKGIFSGLLAAALYLKAGKWGILCNIVAFWVPNTAMAAALIYFSSISLKNSLLIFQSISKQQIRMTHHQLKLVFQKFLYTCFFVLLMCILQTVLVSFLNFALG